MRRFAALLILASVIVAPVPPGFAVSCTGSQIAAGTCSVGGGTTGGGVDLWGDWHTDGSVGDEGGDLDECPVVVNGHCVGTSPPKDGVAPTTVSDVESFRPSTPRQFVEPNGWTLEFVPTNFWSTATTHDVAGELLGNPAEVRFTPVRFRRGFGDGTSQASESPGSTWRELGQTAWTKTATSHGYRRAGTFRVTLTVWYSAEFRFGFQPWSPLEGLVTARANDLTLVVFDSATVLVARPCDGRVIGCAFG